MKYFCNALLSGCFHLWFIQIPGSSSSFSRLFHEIFHDGTTSNAQHYELNRSRPVDKLKTRYFVTLDMMGTNFATLHKRECNCHQDRKLANCFAWVRVCWECSQINSIVFIDSNEKMWSINTQKQTHTTHTHSIWVDGGIVVLTIVKIFRRLLSTWGTLSFIIRQYQKTQKLKVGRQRNTATMNTSVWLMGWRSIGKRPGFIVCNESLCF